MKENLQTLLASLRVEQAALQNEQLRLSHLCAKLNDSRRNAARHELENLLPDLRTSSIRELQDKVPDFQVPMVSAWFGLSQKVDPSVSIDMLRVHLGVYLDHATRVPVEWKDEVLKFDLSILLQEKLIHENAEHLDDLNMRIVALEKLSNIDADKLKPETRERMEQAVAAQAAVIGRRGESYARASNRTPRSYPAQSQISSDSDLSLLEMWFWYEMLNSNSESSYEMEQIQSGGGTYGGAGASGGWSEPEVEASGVANDTLDDSVHSDSSLGFSKENVPVQDTESMESIDTHYDLGAGNFS